MSFKKILFLLLVSPCALIIMAGITALFVLKKCYWFFSKKDHFDEHETIRYILYRCVMSLEWPMNLEKHLKSIDREIRLAAIHEVLSRSSKDTESFVWSTLRNTLLPEYSKLASSYGDRFIRKFHEKYVSFFGDSEKYLLDYASVLIEARYMERERNSIKRCAEDFALKFHSSDFSSLDIELVFEYIKFIASMDIQGKKERISMILKEHVAFRAYLLTPKQWILLAEKGLWDSCLTGEMQNWVRNFGKTALKENGVKSGALGFA